MKSKPVLVLVLFFSLSLIAINAWGFGPPPTGAMEIIKEEELLGVTLLRVTLPKLDLPNGLISYYYQKKNDGGEIRDLTAIYPPPNSDVSKIIRRKIPVDIHYPYSRMFNGRYWEYESAIEITLAEK